MLLDYLKRSLVQRGQRVTRLQVVGLAAELALTKSYKESRKGVSNLQWRDLGGSLTFYDVIDLHGCQVHALCCHFPG